MELTRYLSDLKNPALHLSAAGLQHLHALSREQAEELRAAWPQVPVERRRQVVQQLLGLTEDSVELDFDAVFFMALEDEDAEVRAGAVKGLWEHEGRDLIDPLLRLLRTDEEPRVRAEAALALGRFVLASEWGHLQEGQWHRVEAGLREAIEDDREVHEVRARALEAVGAHDCQWVRQAIMSSYDGEVPRLKVSAVHAMGRSCQRRWLTLLVDELANDDPEIRYEAALALGSLGERSAVADLAPLLDDPDIEVKEAAIAALGQIGGREAKAILRPLAADQSAAVQEAAAAALAEADFVEDPLTAEYRL